MTPIRNKAEEVKAWIDRSAKNITYSDVLQYTEERWPELDPDIRRQIADAVIP